MLVTTLILSLANSLTKRDWEQCRGLHPLCPSDCLDIQDHVCGGKFKAKSPMFKLTEW